jgi:polysaccharide deacetylase family protein (PEP-CTERM system associated)
LIETKTTDERIANALTVDVEEHFQVSAFEGVVQRRDWDSMPSRVEENTARILDLLEAAEIRGTFFVLGWIGEKHPGLVRAIAQRGHEIGCHGYSHKLIYEQPREEFREELVRSKKILEDAGGEPVDSHRAASFSICRESLWALDILVESGFRRDSSLFPIRHDRYGMPDAPRRPCLLRTPGGGVLLEVPPSTITVAGLTLPVAGGGYLRLYPASFTHWAIRRLNRRGIPANVYFHPWEIDPEQPRVNGLPWKSRARHYVNLKTTLGKLRSLLAAHRFGPMREIFDATDDLPEEILE